MRRQMSRLALCSALGTLLTVITVTARAADRSYGPVRAKESLSQIAYALRPEKTRLCTYQTITALYRANPGAFEGSPEHIRPGSVLRVPDAGEITAIPAAEAYAVYHSAPPPAPIAALPMSNRLGAADEPPSAPPAPAAPPMSAPPAADSSVPEIRRRTGEQRIIPADSEPLPDPNRVSRLAPVAAPEAWKEWEKAPIPDRWRLLNNLGLVPQRWYDPYNQNTYKADKPIRHGDEFINLAVTADTVYEYRRLWYRSARRVATIRARTASSAASARPCSTAT